MQKADQRGGLSPFSRMLSPGVAACAAYSSARHRPCSGIVFQRRCVGLELVDKAHIHVPEIFSAVGVAIYACAVRETTPHAAGVVQPQGDVVGLHQQLQVFVYLVLRHEAYFKCLVFVCQIKSVVIGGVEIRSIGPHDVVA